MVRTMRIVDYQRINTFLRVSASLDLFYVGLREEKEQNNGDIPDINVQNRR